ncbi:hypothetical protein K435DRAFT_692870, partial [Dendrothele bispora CBS 962.96]
LVWDILSHLGDDYRMLTRYPLSTPIIVYFVSRFSTCGLLITGLFIGPAKIHIDCHLAAVFLELFFFLSVSSTTALFALRVRAIYSGYYKARAIFLLLWIVTSGSCILGFFILDSTQNPDKEVSNCLFEENNIVAGITIGIAAMIHDTVVFVAISYQMYNMVRLADPNRSVVEFFMNSASGLPPLWRCLLQDGQLFYLIALFWQITVTSVVIIPSLGVYYRCFLLSVQLVVVSSIACHVFRNVRLGKFREHPSQQDAIEQINLSTNSSSLMKFAPMIHDTTACPSTDIPVDSFSVSISRSGTEMSPV